MRICSRKPQGLGEVGLSLLGVAQAGRRPGPAPAGAGECPASIPGRGSARRPPVPSDPSPGTIHRNAARATASRRDRTSARLASRSQTFTVESKLPETIRRPSGLNARLCTAGAVSPEGEDVLTRGCVPELDGQIITAGGEAAAVGAEGDAPDQFGVSLKLGELAARQGIPDPRFTVMLDSRRRPRRASGRRD